MSEDTAQGGQATPPTDEPTDRQRPYGKETLPDSPPVGATYHVQDDDLRDWMAGEGVTADALARAERARRQNPWRYSRLVQFATTGSRDRVRLLRLLVERPLGVTYRDVDERLEAGERRRKDFVKELRDAEVVETPGRPAIVRFTSDQVQALAADVVAFL